MPIFWFALAGVSVPDSAVEPPYVTITGVAFSVSAGGAAAAGTAASAKAVAPTTRIVRLTSTPCRRLPETCRVSGEKITSCHDDAGARDGRNRENRGGGRWAPRTRGLVGLRGRTRRRRCVAARRGAGARRAGNRRVRRPRAARQRRRGGVRAQEHPRADRGGLGPCFRRNREGELPCHPGRGDAAPGVGRSGRDDRGRCRIPGLAFLRSPLRGQGRAGNADPGLRARPRARGSRLRRRTWAGGGCTGAGG